jgi:hypothetical protein
LSASTTGRSSGALVMVLSWWWLGSLAREVSA